MAKSKFNMREFGSAVWTETKGLFWVLLAVLGVHSFIAKPFYIPSESMMPILLTGDRLVVTKYPYGYSFVSPTIPNPVGIVQALVPGGEPGGWTVTLPKMEGRLFGSFPERGDIVIVTPRGKNEDYIKRVIGLPGDTIEMDNGHLVINGEPVLREQREPRLIPVDLNSPCGQAIGVNREPDALVAYLTTGEDGRDYCALPIIRETLPNGVSYDTVELGDTIGDEYDEITIPEGHVFLMGDNRDQSSDSRYPDDERHNGLGGPIPVEHIGGRAEFITFSLDGTTGWNPMTWWPSLRDGRSGNSLRAKAEEAAE